MKIVIIGATGFVGSAILKELVSRGHSITAIANKVVDSNLDNINWIETDVKDVEKLSKGLAGNDLIVSAYNAGWTNPNLYQDFLQGSKSIQEAVKKSGVKRLIVSGGAGSLYISDGLQVVDTPAFPADWKEGAKAARDYLNILKEEKELDWTFFSPALEMHPGITTGRTGNYRLGNDNPVFDANGKSQLSVEDLAVVIADEAETPKHHQARFTAAY
ncbi:MAG TPA: NAD(P)H-binding protein [Arachidicoccus sp.]